MRFALAYDCAAIWVFRGARAEDAGEEAGHDVAALVFEGNRWHGDEDIVDEQGDQRVQIHGLSSRNAESTFKSSSCIGEWYSYPYTDLLDYSGPAWRATLNVGSGMQKLRPGKSGLEVSALGYGVMGNSFGGVHRR
jgi:hypothetical protein